jgi:hypothetical protein
MSLSGSPSAKILPPASVSSAPVTHDPIFKEYEKNFQKQTLEHQTALAVPI